MRRTCDYIYIIDLGGEGRGTRKEKNVFSIQTPVAIFVAWRKTKPDPATPAVVRYTRIEGTRQEKLFALNEVTSESLLQWHLVSHEWQAPFKPLMSGTFSDWPLLTDLFPWQNSGVECKRTWPIAPDKHILRVRWAALSRSENKKDLFKETRDRKISQPYFDIIHPAILLTSIDSISESDILEPVIYSYRSFDRQWVLPDNRVGDYFRPVFWQTHGKHQVYLSSLFNHPLGKGPALTVCKNVPDRHHFRGSYSGKDIMPLYRNKACSQPNILPGLLYLLSKDFDREVTPEHLASYIYAVLAQPEYTNRFAKELASREVRVPITKDGVLFARVSEFGQRLIWLHTYGERLYDESHPKGQIPKGTAKCTKAVSDSEDRYPNEFHYEENNKVLYVGDGEFAPVSSEVWDFEVSGLKVVQSWLGYRMKDRKGKKSSPLDDIRPKSWSHEFTRELLELLWVLEKTVEGYPEQKELFEAVLKSDLYEAGELPEVPDEARLAPKVPKAGDSKPQIDMYE
jgi:hypothetical protein